MDGEGDKNNEENNCEPDDEAIVEEQTEDHTQHARQEFNKSRKIIIKNVPPVTYDEVKEFMGKYAVSNISISKKFRHALVTMLHGQEAEQAVDDLRDTKLLDTEVQAELYHNENLLCVTHLPFNISHESFLAEMKPYGTIEKCFLMKFKDTGKSKGYGFVEFVHNKEKSEEACQQLNGRRMGSCILQCNLVDSSVVSFEQLQSCCLLIDHLPAAYSNLRELKALCSTVTEPVYCKLGEKEERMLGFGVVKYESYQQAEETQMRINGHKISGHSIRLTFCMPGKSADDIYQEIVEIRYQRLMALKTPPPLMSLPEIAPPIINPENITSPVIKRLLAQNANALTNFSSVLNLLQLDLMKQQMSLRPGLLGMAPSLPASPLMNPDLQIALLSVLLAQQIQLNQPEFVSNPSTQQYILRNLDNQQTYGTQGGARPSLLGNPYIAQANTLLSSIKPEDEGKPKKEEIKVENQSEAKEAQKGPGITLFPPTDQALNTNILTNFNQLLTTLNTPSKSKSKSRLTTGDTNEDNQMEGTESENEAETQKSKKDVDSEGMKTENDDAKDVTSENGNMKAEENENLKAETTQDTAEIEPIQTELVSKNESNEKEKADVKIEETESQDMKTEPVDSKTQSENANIESVPQESAITNEEVQENENEQPNATANNTQSMESENEPQVQSLMSAASNPFFHIPGVGLANPFLATFIEQQIRNHLQTMQHLNLFGATVQLQNQQQASRQGTTGNIPSLLSNNGGGLLGAAPNMGSMSQRGGSLLGAPPQGKPPSLLGTPTSWNRNDHLNANIRIPEKRTLNFDEGQSGNEGSLLGAHPMQAYQAGTQERKGPTGGTWEGFCKSITIGKNDGPTAAKRVKPLMPDTVGNSGDWSQGDGQYGEYGSWDGDWGGYSQSDYDYSMQQYSQYCDQYNTMYQQYGSQYQDYWSQYASQYASTTDKTDKTDKSKSKDEQNSNSHDYEQYYSQYYGYGWGGEYDSSMYDQYGSIPPPPAPPTSLTDSSSYTGYASQTGYGYDTKKRTETSQPRYNTQYYKQSASKAVKKSRFEPVATQDNEYIASYHTRDSSQKQSEVSSLMDVGSSGQQSTNSDSSNVVSSLLGNVPSLLNQEQSQFGGKVGSLSAKPVKYDPRSQSGVKHDPRSQSGVKYDPSSSSSSASQDKVESLMGSGYGASGMERSDDGLMPPPTTSYGHLTPAQKSRLNPHLLPSPEPSPDNAYVGQHSQGIGGHYADSYASKF